MSEQHDEAPGGIFESVAHILDDLHGLCREVAALRAVVEGYAARLDQLDELLPAARRAAALFDTPVTGFLAARREANGGTDQRAGTRTSGRGRARAARRKLPDA